MEKRYKLHEIQAKQAGTAQAFDTIDMLLPGTEGFNNFWTAYWTQLRSADSRVEQKEILQKQLIKEQKKATEMKKKGFVKNWAGQWGDVSEDTLSTQGLIMKPFKKWTKEAQEEFYKIFPETRPPTAGLVKSIDNLNKTTKDNNDDKLNRSFQEYAESNKNFLLKNMQVEGGGGNNIFNVSKGGAYVGNVFPVHTESKILRSDLIE